MIKELRMKNKLTQEELASKCGLSKNAIWNYENNKRSPSIDTLKKIANALDVNVYNLIDANNTLTSKLLKLFEETVCQGWDSKNTLELLCESIDIDEEVINEALNYNEDLSESYLVSLIDIISKEYPEKFQKFYEENRSLIFSKYFMCYKKCEELQDTKYKHLEEDFYNQYKKIGAKIEGNRIILPPISFEEMKKSVDKQFPLLDAEITFLSNPNLEKIFNYSYNNLSKYGYENLLIIAIEKVIKQTLTDIKNHIEKGDIFDGFGSWISKESPVYETIKKIKEKNENNSDKAPD